MAKNYFADGDIIDIIALSNIKSGDLVIKESIIGIAITDINQNETGPVQRTGTWILNKKVDDSFMQGAGVYWDNTNKQVTSTSTDNTLIGFAYSAVLANDDSVRVVLKN